MDINTVPGATLPRGASRYANWILDRLTFVSSAGNLQLVDTLTGRTIIATAAGGAVARNWAAFANRWAIEYTATGRATFGSNGITLPYSVPVGGWGSEYAVQVVGAAVYSTTLALPAIGQDQGFFLKTVPSASTIIGSVYANSVSQGVIPADERAFGVNRNVATGLWEFVSVVGTPNARVVTPLPWPAADVRTPVLVEFIIEAPTLDRPGSALFTVRLNGTRVPALDRVPMVAGNLRGLPFNWDNVSRLAWLPVFANEVTTGVGAVDVYYRAGTDLEGTL